MPYHHNPIIVHSVIYTPAVLNMWQHVLYQKVPFTVKSFDNTMGRKPHLVQDLEALPNGNMIALTARAGGDLANKNLHKEHSYIL